MAIFNTQQLAAIQTLRDNSLDSFSSTCKLWYPPEFITCPNPECLPVATNELNNIGLHGGPVVSICPLCAGTNKIQKEVTDTINLIINWTPNIRKKDKNEAPFIKLPYDFIEVKGYLNDLPKLQQSIELQAITGNFPITNARYKLDSDGFDSFNVTQGRYFLAILERVS